MNDVSLNEAEMAQDADQAVIDRAEREAIRRMLASAPPLSTDRVSPTMVSDYVDGLHPDSDGKIKKTALSRDLALRRLYKKLVEERSVAHLPKVRRAAAGGGAGPNSMRLGNATLSFRETVPGSGRHMLLLRFERDVPLKPDARPILHVEWKDGMAEVQFPKVGDGERTTQCILSSNDPCIEHLIEDVGRPEPSASYNVVA